MNGHYCSECGHKKYLKFFQKNGFCIFCLKKTHTSVHITVSDTITTHDSNLLKKKSDGFRSFALKIISGWFPSHGYKDGVNLSRTLDKEKDEYHEVVTNYKSGKILHESHERLSQHVGHGSDRRGTVRYNSFMSKTRLEIIFFIVTAVALGFFFSHTTPNTLKIEKSHGAVSADVLRTVDLSKKSSPVVVLGDNIVHVGIADTDATRIQGLSGRKNLDPDTGLFFIFDKPFRVGIWMKDMNFPIDILWFNRDLELITVKENATPASYPEIFYPTTNALYVLEVPAGYVRSHNISIGDKATFSRN